MIQATATADKIANLLTWTLALLCLAAPVSAAEPIRVGQKAPSTAVLQTINQSLLETIMRREGYEIRTDEDGDLEWTIDGYRAFIYVAEDKKSLLFRISFSDTTITAKKVNEWNSTKRFSRSYLSDGNPYLELDLDLEGGITKGRIQDFLETCKVSFVKWYREVIM